LKNSTADLRSDKTAAETAATLFDTTVASLVKLGVPAGLYAGLQRAGDAAKTG
jgi:hypothetical protein